MELFIFAGPNGSGKSTLAAEFIHKLNLFNFEYVNPDIYASKFFNSIINEKDRYQAAFDFAERVRMFCFNQNKNMIIETVNSTDNKFEFYKNCKEKNHKITVVYVCTQDPKINIERVHKRKSEGGHDVLEDKVVSRYYKSLENLFP